MPYKNLTVTPRIGAFDGFGSQYLKKLSGYAFCIKQGKIKYRYIHTPFLEIDHLKNDFVSSMNDFIGIPDNRQGKKIHVSYNKVDKSFANVDYFFDDHFIDIVRFHYFSTLKPKPCSQEIVIHIRRGDLHLKYRRLRDKKAWEHKRMEDNNYYSSRILNILKANPNDSVLIHSEGDLSEFSTIMYDWPNEFRERITFSLNEDIRKVFNDMVFAKKLFLARSSLSYAAGLLCKGDVFFQNGLSTIKISIPKSSWKNWSIYD